MGAVVDIVAERFPHERDRLSAAVDRLGGEPIGLAARWHDPAFASGTLEKLMGKQPTFLPISFLEVGVARARAIAFVRRGDGRGSGSGFLAPGNLLITNFHVLPDQEAARAATVVGNFQDTASR